jgi:hypothetical protein
LVDRIGEFERACRRIRQTRRGRQSADAPWNKKIGEEAFVARTVGP